MERWLVVVATFGDAPCRCPSGTYPVAWSTPTPVELRGGTVDLPPHAGAVLAPLPT